MDIILQEDYPQLGFVGERVSVKSGYARNFLIPRGIGVEATSKNAKLLNHRLAAINALKEKKKVEAEELAAALGGVSLRFKLKVGELGKTFGSIGTKDIEGALKKEKFAIQRRQISLGEPIKSIGAFTVDVKLHSEVVVSLPIEVKPDRIQKPKADKDTKKGKKSSRRGKKAEAEDVGVDPQEGKIEEFHEALLEHDKSEAMEDIQDENPSDESDEESDRDEDKSDAGDEDTDASSEPSEELEESEQEEPKD